MAESSGLLGQAKRPRRHLNWQSGAAGLLIAVAALACLSWQLRGAHTQTTLLSSKTVASRKSSNLHDDPLSASAFAKVASTAERTFEKTLVSSLKAEAKRDFGDRRLVSRSSEAKGLPSLKQIRQERRLVQLEMEKEEANPVVRKATARGSTINDCGGRSIDDCALELDRQEVEGWEKRALKQKNALPATLLQVSQAPVKALSEPLHSARAQMPAQASGVEEQIAKLQVCFSAKKFIRSRACSGDFWAMHGWWRVRYVR
jgi:hypothetical protein